MLAEIVRHSVNKVPTRYLRHLANWWSPFRGAGIKITYVSPDARQLDVQMRLRSFNRNHVGVHFGGSLYAMTDPFYTIMLIINLGDNYAVWDKQACIEFVKPGKGTVHARFRLSEAEIQYVKQQADSQGRFNFEKTVEVLNSRDELIALVNKVLYIRRRNTNPAASGNDE